MDEKDIRILEALKLDSRQTTNDIWRKTEIPQTTIHNRIKKLKDKGIIKRFTIELNKKLIDRGLSAYIFCTVSYRTLKGEKVSQFDVASNIKRMIEEVEEVSIVTGEIDLIVKVAVKDVDALNEFVIKKLRNIEGVEKTITSVVLTEM